MKYRIYKDKCGRKVKPNDTLIFDNGEVGKVVMCSSPFAEAYPDPWDYDLGILCNSLQAYPLFQFDERSFIIDRRRH